MKKVDKTIKFPAEVLLEFNNYNFDFKRMLGMSHRKVVYYEDNRAISYSKANNFSLGFHYILENTKGVDSVYFQYLFESTKVKPLHVNNVNCNDLIPNRFLVANDIFDNIIIITAVYEIDINKIEEISSNWDYLNHISLKIENQIKNLINENKKFN